MVKIKDISERLVKNHEEYLEIKLIIAKRTLVVFLFLYYTAFLFTIGGFSFWFITIDILSSLTFHLYSVLSVVLSWFLFSLIEYIQNIYYPDKPWLRYFGMLLAILFGSIVLIAHFLPYFV